MRSRIAAAWLGEATIAARLGAIVLHPHQIDAAARLRLAIERFGGALLADEVGLGKTFTALAAMRDAERLLIVAPAALLGMWRSALGGSGVRAALVSLESLSHREPPVRDHDAVIVDEAHHARNPATRRYARLASITARSRVLLLTATPVHNVKGDLDTLLAIFLGSRSSRMSNAERGACIVRRGHDDIARDAAPRRAPPRWLDVSAAPGVLDAIAAIPSACPPRDGADAGALVTLALVRAWASTEAALRGALERRVARAEALADALAHGRHPTRAEMRAWVIGDDATQLAFPELVAAHESGDASATADLLAATRRHATGARRALRALAETDGATDAVRCDLLRSIRQHHRGQQVVIFSQYAESVHAVFRRLRPGGRVAAVTSRGAWVAAGPVSRGEVLARFAPNAHHARGPAGADVIDVLVATDLLSEGLNLQDAAVVVHLDLPWTAARLTQRMGRVWRIGSRHDCVYEYALAPPAPAAEVLRLIERLRRKAGAAWSAVGDRFAPLLGEAHDVSSPCDADSVGRGEPRDVPGTTEALRRTLIGWTSATAAPARHSPPPDHPAAPIEPNGREGTIVAAVRSGRDGWLALVGDGDAARLLAGCDGCEPTTDPSRILEVASAGGGAACAGAPSRVERVLCEIDAWRAAARAADAAGVSVVGSRAQARVATGIAAIAASAPAHRRVVVSRLAAQARETAALAHSAGDERRLAALLPAPGEEESRDLGETWLRRVIDAGSGTPPQSMGAPPASTGRAEPVALLLLVAARRA